MWPGSSSRPLKRSLQGAELANLRGSVVDMAEILEAIFQAAPGARGQIRSKSTRLALPTGMDDQHLRSMLPAMPDTPLQAGVAQYGGIFPPGAAGRADPGRPDSGMIEWKAAAIGERAARILAGGGSARVIGLTSRGIFLVNGGGEIVFLSFEEWHGPLTINLWDGGILTTETRRHGERHREEQES